MARRRVRSVNVSYEIGPNSIGNNFCVQLFKENTDKALYLDLNRSQATDLVQQILNGLKETKNNYNHFVKTGRRKSGREVRPHEI